MPEAWQTATAGWRMSVPGTSVATMPAATPPVPEFERRWTNVDLSGARFHNVVLSGAKITGVWARDLVVDGDLRGLTVNGIDVMPYVEQRLAAEHPELGQIWSGDLDDLRAGWATVRAAWESTEAEVAALDEAMLHERVDDEYSYLETLRHLVFASDAWLRRCLLGETDFWYAGVPHDEMEPEVLELLPIDAAADPALDEVMAVRLDRRGVLDRLLAEATPDALAEHPPARERNGYPLDTSGRTVGECLRCIVNEEWWHHRYATRDLAVVRQGVAER
ncbi:DinB family protein [Nocardioides iriomotensis]|uniref:DinB family protein n=2 Tax=Nocardioides iriomotensis TaxID=715784 RepID=A0A4Q5IX22_9ACTN|nr:DinB family protein [Nocardioides iriomotensis]